MERVAEGNRENKLEEFFREQEKQIKNDDFYSRFMFVPIIVIVVSLVVILYNFTAGKLPMNGAEAKNVILPEADNDRAYVVLVDDEDEGKNIKEPQVAREDQRINLNTASVQQLDALPEIGPVKAGAIVRLREEMGGFRTVEDILNVDGIGEKIFEGIRNKVFVD